MDHQRTHVREKTRGRWSAVDVILILLVLAAVAGIAYRVYTVLSDKGEASNGRSYTVSFEVLPTHEDVLAEVEGFDALYLYENNSHLGYLPMFRNAETGEITGPLEIRPADGPDTVTATGCFICFNGTLSEGSLLVEGCGYYLTPGAEVTVCTERVMFTLRITGITEQK